MLNPRIIAGVGGPVLWLMVLLLGACVSSETARQGHLDRGRQYLRESRYAEARIEFRSALQLDRQFAAAHFGLGEAALGLGYVQEAVEAFYEAIKRDPGNQEARVRLGLLLAQYENEESLKEAERLAREVLERDPSRIEGHLLWAEIRQARREDDEALAAIQRALNLAPDRIETQLHLARFYLRRGQEADLDSAETIHRQLIEKNGGSAEVRLAYGDFLFAQSRFVEAEEQLKLALAANPRDRLVLIALRQFYENRQQNDQAERYLAQLIEMEADRTAGRAQLIDLHARTGRLTQAIDEYRQLLRDNPRYLPGYSRLAELLLETGDRAGATREIERALALSPQDSDALLLRAGIHLREGRFREAFSDLDLVLRFEPAAPAALYLMAEAHLGNNDPTQARLFANRLLSFYPRHPTGLHMLASIGLKEGQSAEAEKLATQMIESLTRLKTNRTALKNTRIPSPALPEWESKALVTRAVARIQSRNYPAAKADLKQALAIDPRSAESHLNLATIHLLEGRLAEALSEADQSVALDPGSDQCVSTLVDVLLRQKNPAEAHRRLESLLQARPNRLFLLDRQARVYLFEGRSAEAERTWRRMLEIDPNYLPAYFALSDFYQSSREQTEQAIAELRRLIGLDPPNSQSIAQAHLLIGLLEESRGGLDAAAKNYERMLSYDPRSVAAAIALNNLAWLYAEHGKGNLDQAVDYARRAIAIAPEAGFYDTLGVAYYRKRQYEVAIDQFSRAIARRPENPVYYLHLARAWREQGDAAQARQALTQAIRLAPSNSPVTAQARDELAAITKSTRKR